MGKYIMLYGRLGMNHCVIDITGENDLKAGDKVTMLGVFPMYVNSTIRREYIQKKWKQKKQGFLKE